MDTFEKQQTIEAIKTVVKARWFFAVTVFIQGLIAKFFFPQGFSPLASAWQFIAVLIASYLYNISYWLYVRRPPEKMTNFSLQTVKALQIVLDALAVSFLLYFSGTTDKLMMVWYFVILMIGIGLYKKRGIALSTFVCGSLYSSVLILEYYGFLVPTEGARNFLSAYKNIEIFSIRLIGFNFYLIAAAFFAWFLGDLFRRREERLQIRTDEAVKKSKLLVVQTQELTKTKDYLHEALTKSDAVRVEVEKTKGELEKANLELKTRLNELEKYGEVTTGRELKMMDLKEKIKTLEKRIEELERK
jgi:hypothetical protein